MYLFLFYQQWDIVLNVFDFIWKKKMDVMSLEESWKQDDLSFGYLHIYQRIYFNFISIYWNKICLKLRWIKYIFFLSYVRYEIPYLPNNRSLVVQTRHSITLLLQQRHSKIIKYILCRSGWEALGELIINLCLKRNLFKMINESLYINTPIAEGYWIIVYR